MGCTSVHTPVRLHRVKEDPGLKKTGINLSPYIWSNDSEEEQSTLNQQMEGLERERRKERGRGRGFYIPWEGRQDHALSPN